MSTVIKNKYSGCLYRKRHAGSYYYNNFFTSKKHHNDTVNLLLSIPVLKKKEPFVLWVNIWNLLKTHENTIFIANMSF